MNRRGQVPKIKGGKRGVPVNLSSTSVPVIFNPGNLRRGELLRGPIHVLLVAVSPQGGTCSYNLIAMNWEGVYQVNLAGFTIDGSPTIGRTRTQDGSGETTTDSWVDEPFDITIYSVRIGDPEYPFGSILYSGPVTEAPLEFVSGLNTYYMVTCPPEFPDPILTRDGEFDPEPPIP